jgi:hypothetical protein
MSSGPDERCRLLRGSTRCCLQGMGVGNGCDSSGLAVARRRGGLWQWQRPLLLDRSADDRPAVHAGAVAEPACSLAGS